ncbi:SARP family transcriptional regulator [Actinoplanes teichomyceticus]|nr:SARP family transcriptional regulator [Actinoplanes teichomyceticus]
MQSCSFVEPEQICPDDARDVVAFLAMLLRLRQRSGLTYRQLEQRAREIGDVLPRSTAADMTRRHTLPRADQLAAFVRACGDGARVESWLAARHRLVGRSASVDGARPPSPGERHPDSTASAPVARDYAEKLLGAGRPGEAVSLLARVVSDAPADDESRRLLVLALHADGRTGDAARICQEGVDAARARGADSAHLAALHRLVVDQQLPVIHAKRPRPAPPRMLPSDPARFVGRDRQLASAAACLSSAPDRRSMIVLITGTAGVGKTSFGIRLAHHVAGHFPDGQLFIDLHGFSPRQTPVAPVDAIGDLLAALQVPAHAVPATLPGRIALYRSLLAGRRILVLLDNAGDADQVRPLLPTPAGCAAVVTSRSVLTSLVTTDGAQPLTLDVLTPAEARELLAQRVGTARVTGDRAAVEEIVDRCARLPLALSVVAARAAARPDFTIRSLATELRDAGDVLDVLRGGDIGTDVRAVLSWSYRGLSSAAARLFRLLALHVGPDIGVAAVASLAGVALREATSLMAELTANHLVTESQPGRYTWHDLLRGYAEELVETEPAAQCRAALRRLLDHYMHTAYTADRALWPQRHDIPPPPPAADVIVQAHTESAAAMRWFTTEQAALRAAVAHAPSVGLPAHGWHLARNMSTFLYRRGRWSDLVTIHRTAVTAAERAGERGWQAQLHREMALAYAQLDSCPAARTHLSIAADLFHQLGDVRGQAETQIALGWVCEVEGDYPAALQHDEAALRLYRSMDDHSGEARARNAVGWDCVRLGRYHDAIVHCREALNLQQALNSRPGQARAWDSLGFAHYHLGEHATAIGCYDTALEFHRQDGDRYSEAETLLHLGDAHDAEDTAPAAAAAWRAALHILTDLEHPDARLAWARLHAGAPLRTATP